MDHDEAGYRSSEDEDYVPPPEVTKKSKTLISEGGDEIEKDKSGTSAAEKLQQKRKIDDLWAEMNTTTTRTKKKTTKTKKEKVVEFKMPVMGVNPNAKKRIKKQQESESTTSVVSFAGVEYSVEKSSASSNSTTSALDAMVSMTGDGPKKITAMEKTSMDWEKFKKSKGISDELEQSTKDGYLEKQDFLSRVDVRTHEIELSKKKKS